MQFIDLSAQYQHLKSKIDKRIQGVLHHGKYIMGPEVFELEERLSEFVGVKHAITCANGTDALTLSLMALDIGEGDAVFCPTFTFFATAEVISFAGATPIFVDSDKDTFNICPIDLEKKIQQVLTDSKLNLKAVIAVDLFGLPANYPEVEKITKKYGLNLVEDAAQGFGGAINGKRAGAFGDIATTSFFPAKPLGCYGDGGAVFTNNDRYAELIRSYRVHGKGEDKYDNVRIGMNSRLDTIQAAILIEKLIEFPSELLKRNELANHYNSELKGVLQTPFIPQSYSSSWAQYTLLSDDRELIMQQMKEMEIPTAAYYRTCMHQQNVFQQLNCLDDELPNASRMASNVFSLPMHPYMSHEKASKIISCCVAAVS